MFLHVHRLTDFLPGHTLNRLLAKCRVFFGVSSVLCQSNNNHINTCIDSKLSCITICIKGLVGRNTKEKDE